MNRLLGRINRVAWVSAVWVASKSGGEVYMGGRRSLRSVVESDMIE